jgi:hypothetical protein
VSPSPYRSLTEHLGRLERRTGDYRFDLEKDVAWHQLGEPGLYFPDSFLRALGLDVELLRSVPDAFDLFQWALALSHCELFAAEEDEIPAFVEREAAELGPTKSVELLVEEEKKHTVLFRRYGQHLRAERPDRVAAFEAAFAPTRALIARAGQAAVPEAASRHYMSWLLFLFFEEYTVWVQERLALEPEGVQAAWLSAHTAHRKEEVQHVLTDFHMLTAIELDEDTRHRLAKSLLQTLAFGFRHYVPFGAARNLVAEAFPGLDFDWKVPFSKTGFYADFCIAPAFRFTREMLSLLSAEEFVRRLERRR